MGLYSSRGCEMVRSQRHLLLTVEPYTAHTYGRVFAPSCLIIVVGCILKRTVRATSPVLRVRTINVMHAATEVEGTFRVNGSNKRMRELQAIFETPPKVSFSGSRLERFGRYVCFWIVLMLCLCPFISPTSQYGKNLDWKQENFTTHDVASVFRRYLTMMPVSITLLTSLCSRFGSKHGRM